MEETTQTHYLAHTLSPSESRKNRRGVALEIKDFAEQVGELEVEFLTDLFTTDRTYQELYSTLQDKYLILCKRVKYRFIIPNKKWITIKYAKQ